MEFSRVNRMKEIIPILIFLISINLVTATTTITFPTTTNPYSGTPSNNTLGCFESTNGGLGAIPCIIGAGFSSLFGSVFLNIFVLIIMIVFCAKLRLPLDLSAIAIFTFVVITNFLEYTFKENLELNKKYNLTANWDF